MAQQSPLELDHSGYFSTDTVAAVISGTGGAVSVIRVGGPLALSSLEALTGKDESSFEDRRAVLTEVREPATGLLIDSALVLVFREPRSFTGETCVEIHAHGGRSVVTALLRALGGLGVRQALAGEFSFRAVRNGKMTVLQAEATADLIRCENDSAATLALEKMAGSQGRLATELAEELRALAALAELGIDFADQDVEEVSLPKLKERARAISERVRDLEGGFERGVRVQEGVQVALLGAPNAGKSSFFNALLGEDRAIVSEEAGTTRDVIRERLTLRAGGRSVTLRLEDTAGVRCAEGKVEALGLHRTFEAARRADLILWVHDVSAGAAPEAEVREFWASLSSSSERTLGILSKTDLVAAESASRAQAALASELGIPWVQVSVTRGNGIPEAVEKIVSICERWTRRAPGEVLLTRLDHLQAVKEGRSHLSRALGVNDESLFASDIRQSLVALAPVFGETLPDDILGRIFSTFCIGK